MNFPDDENGALLQEMFAAGLDLSQHYDVDFFHLFEKKPQAEDMAAKIAKAHPEATVKVFEDETPGVWDVSCTINIQPVYDAICAAEKAFETIAEKCHGYADGWGILGDE
ncbi:MAG: hypothetical protein ACI8WB_001114 [Phenylobacterium sp.]|jgi:hypothetical protein